MPYVIPTPWMLKIKFPRFDPVDDSRVSLAIAEAASEVPLTWRVSDYQPGIMYLAAHLLVIDGVEAGSIEGVQSGTAGLISSIKVGDVETKFGTSSGSSAPGASSVSGYGSTVYGRRFEELMFRNGLSNAKFLLRA